MLAGVRRASPSSGASRCARSTPRPGPRCARSASATPDAFLGDAARRPAWTTEALLAALASVGEGVTELMAHPGHAPSPARTSFGAEREVELVALCHRDVRAAVDLLGIRLQSFADVRVHLSAGPPRLTRPPVCRPVESSKALSFRGSPS